MTKPLPMVKVSCTLGCVKTWLFHFLTRQTYCTHMHLKCCPGSVTNLLASLPFYFFYICNRKTKLLISPTTTNCGVMKTEFETHLWQNVHVLLIAVIGKWFNFCESMDKNRYWKCMIFYIYKCFLFFFKIGLLEFVQFVFPMYSEFN